FSFDDASKIDEYAWIGKNTYDLGNMFAQAVGQKKPNPFGLYDMHGNVWEWVQDYYAPYENKIEIDPRGPESGNMRVFRGGSFYYLPKFTRSAYRGYNIPTHKLFNLGARLAKSEIKQ
ncbi:MAG: formylglycine-generating enzyme family protein, partial [Candidatus Poribacteria bacterium]